MNKVLFKEEQKFGSMSLYLSMGAIYTSVIVVLALAMYSQFVLNDPWGDKPITYKELALLIFLILMVIFLSAFFLFGSKLVVNITNNHIKLTFKPLLKKEVRILNKSIASFEVRQYRPISEYGGWGIKKGKKIKGIAYNVHGNIGLQLYLKDGRKVLIGTQRSDAINRAMNKMMEKK